MQEHLGPKDIAFTFATHQSTLCHMDLTLANHSPPALVPRSPSSSNLIPSDDLPRFCSFGITPSRSLCHRCCMFGEFNPLRRDGNAGQVADSRPGHIDAADATWWLYAPNERSLHPCSHRAAACHCRARQQNGAVGPGLLGGPIVAYLLSLPRGFGRTSADIGGHRDDPAATHSE